jgi:hypothetical protein
MTVTCPNGHENPDGKAFCGDCGAPLPAGSTAQTVAPLPAVPPAEADMPPESPKPDEESGRSGESGTFDHAGERATRRSRVPWLIAAVVVIIGVVIAVVVISQSDSGSDTAAAGDGGAEVDIETARFQLAYDTCGVTSTNIEVADEGQSMILDGPPDSSANSDEFITDLACVIEALNMPEYVVHNMENTTSLMGLQEATWDGIHAQWSYHPDNGLDLVLTEAGS